MALKLPGPLVPGVVHAKPVRTTARLCIGATSKTGMEMMVGLELTIGPKVSLAEAELYLHWASDLLTLAKDDDKDDRQDQ